MGLIIRGLLVAIFVMYCVSCECAESLTAQNGSADFLKFPSQGSQQDNSEGEKNAAVSANNSHYQPAQPRITISANEVLEGFANFAGGKSTAHPGVASTFDLDMSVDTGYGGMFHIDLQDHAGQNPTTDLVGDLQVFDKLNSAPYFQIFELWYQQRLCAGRLRLKIGKVDANTEFSVIDNGLSFLNSSTQVTPTLFVLPTTPAPMPSVNAFFVPNQSHYVSFGVYYANRSVTFGNFYGSPQDAQRADNGVFLIAETGVRWQRLKSSANGNLKLGIWRHTGTFTRFNGLPKQGTYGYYAILNQTIWQPAGEPEDGRGLRGFLEYGRAQESVSTIDWHVGGGITWRGLSAARHDDMVGFSPQYAHISPQAGLPDSYELALEVFYKRAISNSAAVMPDLQYIINPGCQYANALVGTLHIAAKF